MFFIINIPLFRWHVTELDIRSTLNNVCYKVTHDHSVDEATRKKRIQGLLLLGQVFVECGCSEEAGMGDFMARVGSQMKAAAAAQSGAADSKDGPSPATDATNAKSAEHKDAKNAPAAGAAASAADADLD